MNQYKVTYEDLPFRKGNGETTYYNLTMAGDDLSRPTTFVLHRSRLAPEQSMAELDRSVIMGLTKELDRKPDQLSIWSERDHERYDLVQLEVRSRDHETREPLYAQRRDNEPLSDKEYVDKDVNKYEERAKDKERQAEQQELYKQAERQDNEFREAGIQSPQNALKEDFRQQELEEDEIEKD